MSSEETGSLDTQAEDVKDVKHRIVEILYRLSKMGDPEEILARLG